MQRPIVINRSILTLAICMLVILSAGCIRSVRDKPKTKSLYPKTWPTDVVLMQGLRLVSSDSKLGVLTVKSKGAVEPGAVAVYYQSLSGWSPSVDATTIWSTKGQLPDFTIHKGNCDVHITVTLESGNQGAYSISYKIGDTVYVKMTCSEGMCD